MEQSYKLKKRKEKKSHEQCVTQNLKMKHQISLRQLLFTNQHGVISHKTWISKGRKEQMNKQTKKNKQIKWDRKKKKIPQTVIFKQMRLLYTFASIILMSPPLPPHVLMNFRGFPPGCGDSVADFWGWDAHEARLRCPDVVSGDMQEDEIPGGTLSLNLLTTQTVVTMGIFLCKEKFPW